MHSGDSSPPFTEYRQSEEQRRTAISKSVSRARRELYASRNAAAERARATADAVSTDKSNDMFYAAAAAAAHCVADATRAD